MPPYYILRYMLMNRVSCLSCCQRRSIPSRFRTALHRARKDGAGAAYLVVHCRTSSMMSCIFSGNSSFLLPTQLFPKYESITSTLLAPLAPSPPPETSPLTPSEAGKAFKKHAYSLISFAVLPSLQTRGIGKQLLGVGERRAAVEGVGCVLETESDDQVCFWFCNSFLVWVNWS